MTLLPAADTGLPHLVFEAISEAVVSYVEIEKVVLFGSRAKGTWKDGSDIDLCLIEEGITRSILASISWKLNEEGTLPWKFDILVRSLIVNSALLEHIERVGIEVYTRNTLIQPKS
ncbi:MAG: nucleotidyltransferase domain-containing protein [Treponema sp.]|nr:MAG: nucleotidyltransferase domain-containing protein [Treponema sp.]